MDCPDTSRIINFSKIFEMMSSGIPSPLRGNSRDLTHKEDVWDVVKALALSHAVMAVMPGRSVRRGMCGPRRELRNPIKVQGSARTVRLNGYVKQRKGIGGSGSLRSFTMSTQSIN